MFQNYKFWFSAQVPRRSHYISLAKVRLLPTPSQSKLIEKWQDNGGEIVALEKAADILIVDHFRKGLAPGTFVNAGYPFPKFHTVDQLGFLQDII